MTYTAIICIQQCLYFYCLFINTCTCTCTCTLPVCSVLGSTAARLVQLSDNKDEETGPVAIIPPLSLSLVSDCYYELLQSRRGWYLQPVGVVQY